MLILTLSSYNQNDEHLEDFVGVFPDMDAIIAHIKETWGDDHKVTQFEECEEDGKPGTRRVSMSVGYIDNGWGGRYYSVWEVKS